MDEREGVVWLKKSDDRRAGGAPRGWRTKVLHGARGSSCRVRIAGEESVLLGAGIMKREWSLGLTCYR